MVNIGSALATGATISIVIKGVDKFSSTFKKANTGLGILGKSAKIGAAAVAGVGVALVALGVSSAKVAADFEQTQVAFTTMLGSAEKADSFLRELADFAKKTPFTLQGVEGAARKLMAVGFASEDVLPVLKDVGDIASGLGLGQPGLDRLILNLGQVQAQGKLTGRELRDFAVAGIPLLDELAKELGKSTSEIQAMVSAGEISTDVVLKTFRNMTSEGGRFADLMEKQSKTVAGRFSNLKDTVELLQREIGQALLPVIGEMAELFLNTLLPAVKPLIPLIVEFLKAIGERLVRILPTVVEILIKFTEVALEIFDAIDPLIDPLLEIALVIADLAIKIIKPLVPLLQQLAVILASLTPIILALEPAFIAIAKIIEIVSIGIEKLLGLLQKLVSFFASNVAGVLGKITSFTGGAVGKVGKIIGVGDAIIRPNGDVIQTDPRDTLIATKDPGGLGGGITFIVQGDVVGLDPEQISRALNDELRSKISII